MFKNIGQKIKLRRAIQSGWNALGYLEFRRHLEKDQKENQTTTKAEKKWAYDRGFYSDRIQLYGLTDENWQDYINDREFHFAFPFNQPFDHWIDDKLTFYQVLFPFRDHLPRYFYFIDQGGSYRNLCDLPAGIKGTPAGLLELLRAEGDLAVKLFSGSEGVGFYRLSYTDAGGFTKNSVPLSEESLLTFVGSLKNYLVTEYLRPCAELAAIYPHTTNSIRLVVINEPGTKNPIFRGLIRFGSNASGEVDNTSQGAVFAIIDTKTGTYSHGEQDVNYRRVKIDRHPDTGVQLAGQIPQWDAVCTLVRQMCAHLSLLTFMGFDIVISDRGIKVIEINSLPEIQDYQLDGPLKKDPQFASFWARQKKEI